MDDTYHTVSSIVFLGNLAVCYAHTGGYQTSSNPTYYWQAYHVLGDGSIMPYRVNPTPNTVNHASTFPTGATSFTVSAQEGSYVAISQNNVLKGVALVPASGTVNVQVDSGITSGQVHIVVTKPQRQPYIQDINVGGGSQTYNITVSANPTNGGTVTGGGTYNQGQQCTVTASANAGYTFTNWTENGNVVSTQASYSFTVTGNRTLVANFQAQPQNYTISVSANPTNGGTVTGGGTYQQGQSCTVSASANNGYTFTNWTENGNVVSTQANYTFTVTGNRTLVANFTQQQYTITATADPTTGGTVTGGGTFNYGQTCTLTATPVTGYYIFINWTKNGQQVSTNQTYSFTVTESAQYVAHFELQTYSINVSANPSYAGTVEGGGTYNFWQQCTVIAIPNEGYAFQNWTENGNQVSTNPTYSFNVSLDRDLVANFVLQTIEITATVEPAEGGTAIGGGTYNYGDEVTIAVETNEDWAFQNWTENGSILTNDKTFTFIATANRNFVAHLMYTEGLGENGISAKVYPNPAKGEVTLEGENLSHVRIVNVFGQTVYNAMLEGDQVRIDLSGFAKGIYMIHIEAQGGQAVRKIVVE